MNRSALHLLSAALAAALCTNPASGAENSDPPNPSDSQPLVGNSGRPQALSFEGNETFTPEQILSGLSAHLEFHLAAHRLAPLQGYAAELERQITLGYLRGGFPDVSVRATADTNASRMLVRITEGPRYRCGEVLLSSLNTIDPRSVKTKIQEKLAGLEPGAAPVTNPPPALWAAGQPAPCDKFAQRRLLGLVQEALADLGRFDAQIQVRVTPEPSRDLANLEVEVLNEGTQGTLEQFEVLGARINTPQQVLHFLKLEPGLNVSGLLLKSLTNQLADSGRFMGAQATLEPLPKPGTFRLIIELDELKQTPPLDQEFSPVEKALLKFRDWILDWQRRSEDLAWSLRVDPSWGGLQLDGALSASDFVLAARTTQSNAAPVLAHAWVASARQLGLYSAWRQRKFALPRKGGSVKVDLSVVPNPTLENPEGFTLSFSAGMTSLEEQPFQPVMNLAPAAFVREAHRQADHASLSNGVLTIRTTNATPGSYLHWQVDAHTGRLIHFTMADPDKEVRLSAEKGVASRLLREISDATAHHLNTYRTNHGISTGLAFIATDLLESPVTEQILRSSTGAGNPENQRAQALLAQLGIIKILLAEARKTLGPRDLGELLDALNQLAPPPVAPDGNETFLVPLEDAEASATMSSLVAWVASGVLSRADKVASRDSWPWILLRETAFTLAGQGKFTQAELLRLLNADDTGPLACLVTASLLGKVNPLLARAYARCGSSRLTASAFRNDYQSLARTNAILGQTCNSLLRLLRSLGENQITLLTASLPPNYRAFVRDLAQLLRQAPDQPPSEAAWPAFERHWDPVLRQPLQLGLRQFLPQVQFLTDSDALHKRGLMLIQPDAVLQDFDEAAQCFRKAAELGHPGAQFNLGILYELGKGIPQDFSEAMRCYRSAAQQKLPHAGCRIGNLYRDGNGVAKNPDEAARWYQPEAEAGCANAQYSLSRIREDQRRMTEALAWCRRAAEAGVSDAQVHLADILTDGITVAPDFVEACQWLLLATQKEHRLAQIRLRGVKEKLNLQQLEEARKRAADITHRLAEKDKAQEPYPH